MSRAEFEQWWTSLDDETRLDNHKFSAWMGWQASRSAVKIKLPEQVFIESDDMIGGGVYAYDPDETLDALNEAGVSYD